MRKEKSTRRNAQKRVIVECTPVNTRLTALDIMIRRIRYITKLSRAEKYLGMMMTVRVHQQK